MSLRRRARRFSGWGELGYVISIFLTLARFQRRPFPVKAADDKEFDQRSCLFLTFNNSKFTGGTMMIAPQAEVNSGLVEYVRWGPIGRFGLIRNLPTLYDGTHVNHPMAGRKAVPQVEFRIGVSRGCDGRRRSFNPALRRIRCSSAARSMWSHERRDIKIETMSEERRKRQQERDGTAAARRSAKISDLGSGGGPVVAAYAVGWNHKNHRYDEFAKCLSSKQAKMYGLYWCPHCLDQKEMFGKSFQYVNYQECAVHDSRELVAECKAAGTKNFPSWQFAGGPLHEGEFSMEDLSERTGCSLP